VEKTIVLDEDAYKLVCSLRRDDGETFSDALRRHLRPANRATRQISAGHQKNQHREEMDRTVVTRWMKERNQTLQAPPTIRLRRFAE
jgi:negative regulator of replication initiation